MAEDEIRIDEEALAQKRAELAEAANRVETLAQKLRERLAQAQEEAKTEAEERSRIRTFVSPLHPNTRFLVRAGSVHQVRDPNSPTGLRDMFRSGDKWAVFQSGILQTDDPEIIAWAENHPEICRDVNDRLTPLWVQLEEARTPKAWREASLDPTTNIDSYIGAMNEVNEPDLVRRAKNQVS